MVRNHWSCVSNAAHAQRAPRLLRPLVSFSSADRCERRRCVPAISDVRVAPAHGQPRSRSNNSERGSTSGRSTNYGSGHLILIFRDIGRIFSLLFLLSHPSSVGHPLRRTVQKRKPEYRFVDGKKRFQLYFVRNSPSCSPAKPASAPWAVAARWGTAEADET